MLNEVPPAATFTRREMLRNVDKCRKMLSFVDFFEVTAAAPPAATLTHQKSRKVEKCYEMSRNVEFCRILAKSLMGGP